MYLTYYNRDSEEFRFDYEYDFPTDEIDSMKGKCTATVILPAIPVVSMDEIAKFSKGFNSPTTWKNLYSNDYTKGNYDRVHNSISSKIMAIIEKYNGEIDKVIISAEGESPYCRLYFDFTVTFPAGNEKGCFAFENEIKEFFEPDIRLSKFRNQLRNHEWVS